MVLARQSTMEQQLHAVINHPATNAPSMQEASILRPARQQDSKEFALPFEKRKQHLPISSEHSFEVQIAEVFVWGARLSV